MRGTLKKVFLTTMAIALGGSIFLAAVIFFGFRIGNLQIEGNSRVSNEEIENMIQLDKARENSLLLCFLNRKQERIENVMVRSIEVSLDTPGDVLVKVTEEEPVACVYENGKYTCFNDQGIVLFDEKKAVKGIPVISGISVSVPAQGEKLDSQDTDLLDGLVNTAAVLKESQVQVQELEASRNGTYTARMGDVKIRLGQTDNMKEKAQEILNLSDQLKGLTGTLHLDQYDASAQTIIFSKEKPETETENEEETVPEGLGETGEAQGENTSGDETFEGSDEASQWEASEGGSDGSYEYEDQNEDDSSDGEEDASWSEEGEYSEDSGYDGSAEEYDNSYDGSSYSDDSSYSEDSGYSEDYSGGQDSSYEDYDSGDSYQEDGYYEEDYDSSYDNSYDEEY